MKTIATFLVPLALCVGCSTLSPEAKLEEDKKLFEDIVAFHRRQFPETQWKYPATSLSHGPIGEMWIPVNFPPELESHYFHDFSVEYLQQELLSGDDLRNIIADDLLLLKNPIKSKRSGSVTVRVKRGLTEEQIQKRMRFHQLELESFKRRAEAQVEKERAEQPH